MAIAGALIGPSSPRPGGSSKFHNDRETRSITYLRYETWFFFLSCGRVESLFFFFVPRRRGWNLKFRGFKEICWLKAVPEAEIFSWLMQPGKTGLIVIGNLNFEFKPRLTDWMGFKITPGFEESDKVCIKCGWAKVFGKFLKVELSFWIFWLMKLDQD